jgi:hypothetical protein
LALAAALGLSGLKILDAPNSDLIVVVGRVALGVWGLLLLLRLREAAALKEDGSAAPRLPGERSRSSVL